MKVIIPLVILFSCYSTNYAQKHWEMINNGSYSLVEIQKEAAEYFKNKDKGKGSGYKQYKRWEYFALKDADQNNSINWRNRADIEVYKFKKKAKLKGHSFTNRKKELWTELGPSVRNPTSSWNPGLGRIECISVDPSNSNHILAGAPTGGVWVTLDGGSSWTPLTDHLTTLDVLAASISPHNNQTYFIGTDKGIYKSIDGGSNWDKITSTKTVRVKPDPNDSSIVMACGTYGIFRSINGGNSFSTVSNEYSLDLEYHPTNSDIIYASGRIFLKSTNNGLSFTEIEGPSGTYSRLAVSEAEPNSVWLTTTDGNEFDNLYKSINSGTSFTSIHTSTTDYFEGYGWYGIDIAVSNENPDLIYTGGMELYRSTDGGNNFSLYVPWTYGSAGAKYIHADIHSLEWAHGTLYTGTDGGISVGKNSESSFTDLSIGLNTRQFYLIDISETDPTKILGGAQDNGTVSTYGTNYNWQEWLGADGMDGYVSRFNSNNQVGTSQNGGLYKTTNGGLSRSYVEDEEGNWVTPVCEDPEDADVFYVGYTAVKKYSFASGTGTDLGTPNGSGKCNELKVAESDHDIMFAAKGSNLSKSIDGGNSWTSLTSSLGSINDIDIHPSNPDIVVVATSGSSKVYLSLNGGTSWTGMKHNLPNISANCVAIADGDSNAIYVGMYSGVYYINSSMTEWTDFQDNLPNVRVNELIISSVNNRIYAGTYGRGAWSAPTYETANQIDAAISAQSALSFCSNESVVLEAVNNSDYSYQWIRNSIDIEGATTRLYTATQSGNYSVRITTAKDTVESEQIEVETRDVAEIPTVENQVFCASGETVTFTVDNPVHEIRWFANQSDDTPIHIGDSLISVLSSDTSFFVEQSSIENTIFYGGASDSSESSGGIHAGGYGIKFNVLKDMVLMTFEVYAKGSGIRNFVLKNSNDYTVYNENFNLPDGKSTVILNWSIEMGTGYTLSCEKINSNAVNLYRNNDITNYPYDIGNLVSIYESTATGYENQYYYYFYNWQVKEDLTDCPSQRIKVNASLDLCTFVNELSDIGIRLFPNPVLNNLTIQLENKDCIGSKWTLFDSQGRMINNGKLEMNQSISFEALSSGFYYLKVNKNGAMYSTEIIKQ